MFIRKQGICIWLYTEHSFIIYYRSEFFCLKEKMARPKRSPFQQKPSFLFFFSPSFIFLPFSISFLSHSHSRRNCHENELLICFPKEFLMPRRPDSRNTMVVMWSTNNFPGLHCLSKALFHPALIM